MSIKFALLKSGESVIADIKELVQEESVRGYLFKQPHFAGNMNLHMDFLQKMNSDEDDGNMSVFFPVIRIPLTQMKKFLCDMIGW